MNRRTVWVGLMCFCLVGSVQAQTEKEIVRKYQVALQKMVDSMSVYSMEGRGVFKFQKIDMPTTIYSKNPHLTRIEMSFQNVKFLQITNDSLRWEYNPFENKEKLTRNEKVGGKNTDDDPFDFVNFDLLQYTTKGHRLKLMGTEKLDSLEVYRLELTKKDKSSAKIYIHTRTHLIYKIIDDKGYRYFADYVVQDGFVFPRFMASSKNKDMVVRFNQIRFNVEFPDSLFTIPKSAFEAVADGKRSVMVQNGDSLKAAGKYQEAVNCYSKAIEIDKTDYIAYNERGLLRIHLKEYYDAIADFDKVMEINASFVMAYNNRGFAKYSMGDYAAAIKDYTLVLDKFPATALTLRNRGWAYYFYKKVDLAEQDFLAAVKADTTRGASYCELGQMQAQLGKYEEALKSYEVAVQKHYTEANLYNLRGVSEYKLQRFDSATISFKAALAKEPDHAQYIENYGRALYEIGKYDAAAEQFERLLKMGNPSAEIQNLNGLCKFNTENYKGAIKDFTRCIELNGKEATYYDNRASAKEELEDYEGAIQDYGESIRIYPNDASVFYRRGLVKLRTSKKIEGCLDLATANEMKYEPAKEAILQNCN